MIAAVVVFTLSWSAFILMRPDGSALRRPFVRPPESTLSNASDARKKTASTTLHDAALLVGELAALLRAGRSAEQMWRQAALSARRRLGEGALDGPKKSLASTHPTLSPEILCAVFVLEAAARAASLGIQVAPAIRDAMALVSRHGFPTAASAVWTSAGSLTSAGPPRTPRSKRLRLREPRVLAVWGEVAACVETAEASGCPLAAVFDRLSSHLEAEADAAAARATALAGPKATTRILTVLPFGGLLLGTLIGAEPLEVLTGTLLGFICLIAGIGLALAGRLWSSRLVAQTGALR